MYSRDQVEYSTVQQGSSRVQYCTAGIKLSILIFVSTLDQGSLAPCFLIHKNIQFHGSGFMCLQLIIKYIKKEFFYEIKEKLLKKTFQIF